MKGQVLSLDLINSVIGFLLIVGVVILVINSSNLRSIYEYELFKMSFIEANRLMFSTLGLVDERGFLNTANISSISSQKSYVQRILNSSGYNIEIDLYFDGLLIGTGNCGNKSIRLSTTRYLIYNGTLHNVTLVGCR